ncbi:endothelin-converting enzyme [Archangium gephyra]|uniref:Endothelin-converting enzyme n=1 Tax=Archangium gephyra TaxID=48 RepID=A0AAC8QA08_9BACT|nr:M13 family metallopeptidase [Archangium gephyra]AKJ03768.1 Metallopeptidase [Archangium gephyra]REG23550.1 endothelin-converting enzyme [Archangium gephyra]
MKFQNRRFPSATRVVLTASASALLAACVTSAPMDKKAAAPPAHGSFGIDTAGMDTAVAPGDSFYRYVNGTWLDKTEIPADRSSYGMFTKLAEEASRRTRALIEEAASTNAPAGSEVRKLGDLFASFMDEAGIEAKGLAPIQPELERIAAITTRKELSAALGDTLRADVDALNTGDVDTDRLFGLWVTQDMNEPSRYAAYLLQGGLGLPDRDYYLVDNARFSEVRQKYQQHIAAMLGLAGIPDAEARARRIFELERELARVHWSQVDTQDVAKVNNPWPRSEFAKRAPGLDWDAYFEAAGLGKQQEFIIWQPSALTGISKLVGSEPVQTWKDYLAFHALERGAPFLSKAFVDESFAFSGRVLSGAQQLRERWKRGVDVTSGAMGEAIGKLYVEKYFPPEAKAEADKMVRNIVTAFGQRIDALAWMSPETKARAKEKLGTLQVGIGHPAKWRDYSGLEIVRGDAYGNAERASRFEYQRNLAKLGKPVDRSEWFMPPQLVNALNSPQQNSIIFPAAILQPPFFDPNADPAVNYGGIGTVIGHEIVHSFDDVGAQFDAQGKLANWWTKEDAAKFKAAGEALVAQYNTYRPLPDLAVNGELTLGENIADIAGVAIALDGYRLSLGGKPAPVLEGFSGEQRFFLGFGQVWRNKYREPYLRRILMTDGHSPGEYRASTVRNIDAWYQAFGATPGQTLYLTPEQRVRIW